MALKIADYVTIFTKDWMLDPAGQTPRANLAYGDQAMASYSTTESGTPVVRRGAVQPATYLQVLGGEWKSYTPASLPDRFDFGDESMAYAADEGSDADPVVPTDWPADWTFPGPPWPPGFPGDIDNGATMTVTLGPVVITYTGNVEVPILKADATPESLAIGHVIRLSAKIGAVVVQMKKTAAGTYANTVDYVVSQYDGTNYGIEEDVYFDVDSADIGSTLTVTATLVDTNPSLLATDTEEVVRPVYYYWTNGTTGAIYKSKDMADAALTLVIAAAASATPAALPVPAMYEIGASSYWVGCPNLVVKTTDEWATIDDRTAAADSVFGDATSTQQYLTANAAGNRFAGIRYSGAEVNPKKATNGLTFTDAFTADASPFPIGVFQHGGDVVIVEAEGYMAGVDDFYYIRRMSTGWTRELIATQDWGVDNGGRAWAYSDGTTAYLMLVDSSNNTYALSSADLSTWTVVSASAVSTSALGAQGPNWIVKADDGSFCALGRVGYNYATVIYRSTNGMASWSAVHTGAGSDRIRGLFKDTNGDLYALRTSPTTWLKSTDDGATWAATTSDALLSGIYTCLPRS